MGSNVLMRRTKWSTIPATSHNKVSEIGQLARDCVDLLLSVEDLAVLHSLPCRRRVVLHRSWRETGSLELSRVKQQPAACLVHAHCAWAPSLTRRASRPPRTATSGTLHRQTIYFVSGSSGWPLISLRNATVRQMNPNPVFWSVSKSETGPLDRTNTIE